MEIALTVSIEKSLIAVTCGLNRYNEPTDLAFIHNRAMDLSRSIVNLFAFATGLGFLVHFDTFVMPDGTPTSWHRSSRTSRR